MSCDEWHGYLARDSWARHPCREGVCKRRNGAIPAFPVFVRGFFRMATLHLIESHGGKRMLGNRFRSESGKEPAGDERLSALLQQWKSVEPQANFEAAVWRRIRADQVVDRGSWRFVETWREWLAPLPAWVNVAAAAGIVVGVGMGLSTPAAPGGRQADEPLLHSQTLAGSYLAMATGRTQ